MLDYETHHIINGTTVNFTIRPLKFRLNNNERVIDIEIDSLEKHSGGIFVNIMVTPLNSGGEMQRHELKSLVRSINSWDNIEIIH